MATITSSTLGELLKRLYASWEIEQLVNLTFPTLSALLSEGSADLGGVGFYFPVRTRGNFAHAYIGESDTLPAGRVSEVKQALIAPTVFAGVAQLTGLSMAVSSGSAASFARAYDENVSQLVESMSAYKEGALFRDGTGHLATLVTEPDGAKGETIGELIFDDVSHLRAGMVIDVLDTDLSTVHEADMTITGVDWATKSCSFDSDVAVAAATGDFIVMADSSAATAAHEPIGFEGSLLASGTYLGLARATYAEWQSETFAASSLFDEEVIQRARVRLTQRSGIQLSGMSGRLKIATHPMQAEILFKLAIPRVRYNGTSEVDLLNSSEAKVGGMSVVTSHMAPFDKAYMGDFKYSQALYTPNGKLHVDTEYNGSALKWVATKDQGLVFLKEYCAWIVRRPNAFVRITSLTGQTR
jgi:hypothetical protein